MGDFTNILIVPGSLREPSYSCSLGRAIEDALIRRGAQPSLWDLRHKPLPLANPAYHHNPEEHPNACARAFVEVAADAGAVVFITPIYHNGVSGVLKNAIDFLTIELMAMKPVGLASHGGARTTQAVEQLRIITRGLQALAITAQVCTAQEDFGVPDNESIHPVTNERIAMRIGRFCDELLVMARLMPTARKMLSK